MMCFGAKNRKRVKTNHCVIVLLDDTQLVHELQASSTGQDLLDVVIKHLNLLETAYFGLRYFDPAASDTSAQSSATAAHHNYQSPNNSDRQQAAGEPVWLDVTKNALKQLRDVNPMTVYLGVKYYASDPCKLAEEITRYQFFLQCKQDILHSRLPVSFELAVDLFALAVQSELGDYDPQRHHEGYVSEFQFLPNQTLDLECRVALVHRTLAGQMPATAEMNFLERVKWLDLYGCELHPIQYEDNGDEYALGLNPSGVLVLRNRLKVAQYLWPRIVKTKCQGRCFLMDVIDNNSCNNNQNVTTATTEAPARNRFGFRLASREASRRLRWSIEEHKIFHHLVHDSALRLNRRQQPQHPHRQQTQQPLQPIHNQQPAKLSQKFRNSIRSAIGIGGLSGAGHFAATLQHQQQQKLLRSSMKSLGNAQVLQHRLDQDAHQLAATRAPPTVFRVPSRRYGNRSLRGIPFTLANPSSQAANGNGLPAATGPANSAAQRQHVAMMNQLNQQQQHHILIGKSQTLKPMSKSSLMNRKESKRSYQQMLMLMAAANGHQPPPQQLAEISVLLPGRHIVQPSIYKSSSVVNGLNQLGTAAKNEPPSAIMQLFNTKPQYPAYHASGHESPRSTKSAIATSSALKMASKRLLKEQQRQQLLLYGANHLSQSAGAASANNNSSDLKPLLTYATELDDSEYSHNNQSSLYGNNRTMADLYYGQQQHFLASYADSRSANHSPRSVRSARMAQSKHRSKSTNENLHLLHQPNYVIPGPLNGGSNSNDNKMLLATTHQLMQQQLVQSVPPPDYYPEGGERRHLAAKQQQQRRPSGSDNESELSKLSRRSQRPAARHNNLSHHQKRAAFALNAEEANLLLSGAGKSGGGSNSLAAGGRPLPTNGRQYAQDDDDYCCSRSDCSSLEAAGAGGSLSRQVNYANRRPQERRDLSKDSGGAGEQVFFSNANQMSRPATNNSRRSNQVNLQQQAANNNNLALLNEQSAEWNAIRRRHNEFSSGKGFLAANDAHRQPDASSATNSDQNNNLPLANGSNGLLKNIANKQATPILLSMNGGATAPATGTMNSKAVQLLNLQRQQLSSQSPSTSADSGAGKSSAATATTVSSSSSLTPSPQQTQQQQQPSIRQNQSSEAHKKSANNSDSASSTTSGYYGGSNSGGEAQQAPDSPGFGVGKKYLIGTRNQNGAFYDQWQRHDPGSQAKIALGQYTARASGGLAAKVARPQQQQGFKQPNADESDHSQSSSQWSPQVNNNSNNTSAGNTSLKYVSFDV